MKDAGIHIPVLTKAPELLQFVPAEYPPEAKEQNLSARVALKVTIAPDGSVSDATVIEPMGHGFDEAAIAAVKQFKFSPAEIDGAPASVQIEYAYNFVLSVPDAGVDAGPAEPVLETGTLKGELIVRGRR